MKSLVWFLLVLFAVNSGALASRNYADTTVKNRYNRFSELSVTQCRPQGWIKTFLNRQRSGLTGHPEVLSYPYNSCLWAGNIERVDEMHGDNWWRYEQTAYYSDGLLRLGYLLNDKKLIEKAREGIRYTLSHPQKNGRLGPDLFASQWPVAVYFRVLQAEYMATGDARILEALHKHYLSYTPDELGKFKRAIINIEGVLWVYGKTSDKRLLELAEAAYALGGFELNLDKCLSPDTNVIHGVTYMEMAKLPAILYMYTGKQIYLDAALNAMYKLDRDHMLPDGVPSSNEFLAGKNPLNSHETCDVSDYSWAVGYLLMATGDASWADHIEKAIFNAGPGSVSKDFKNLQYFSSPNQFIATGNSNQNKFKHGSTWMAYWPCHETECCAGNVHRFMPNYAARMWMRDNNGGMVAALYGPSVGKAGVGAGNTNVEITEETAYPFSESIVFRFNPAAPVQFPFSFRIPAWCTKPVVTINGKAYDGVLTPGSFITINRLFRKNDVITLSLPMDVQLVPWENNGVAVERGPLLFAYPITEKVRTDTATYANLGGKRSPDPAFPALDIQPAGSWNYGLGTKDIMQRIQVQQSASKGYPFDVAATPVVVRIPAHRLHNWTLEENRYTPALPAAGTMAVDTAAEMISLVPYGSTRLRMAVFPVTQKIRIACVGNSITFGAGIPDSKNNAYPAQLQQLLGGGYEVSNFGVSGTTLLKQGNNPYVKTTAYSKALQSRPDLVFIKLGTNDSKPGNRSHYDQFKNDLHELVQSFVQLPSRPRVVLLLPVAAFVSDSNSIYDPVIVKKIIPMITQVAYADGLEVIDLHSLFTNRQELLPDKIHPNKEGASLIAERLYRLIKQNRDTSFNILKALPAPDKTTSFYGYRCSDFSFNGRNCKVVQPKWAANDRPWVWRARFWGHEPQTDIALLERGFHVVYCDVVELYGNREAIRLWNDFYSLMRKAGLAPKAVMEGMSRGGVYVYNWAAENPEKIACVYADNPVLDLKSWPGALGKGPGSKGDWITVIADYGLDTTATAVAAFAESPVNKIPQIVKGGYPMLHVCGDADEVVPMEENTIPFEEKVKALHGNITVIHKPGFKHHPHSLPNPTPIVDFILKATKTE